MILQHYLELFRYYRRTVVWIVAATTLATLIASVGWLFAFPMYTSATSVVMMPSDAQIAFSHDMTVGLGSIQSLSETHIEYLKSTPVVEAVYDKIAGAGFTESSTEGLSAKMRDAARGTLAFVWKTYRILNSGKYVEPEPREVWIKALRDGIVVQEIPGSYILQIEATLPHPKAAPMAADMVAEAYMELWSKQLNASADKWEAFFDDRIAERQAELDALILQEFEVKKSLGLLSLEEERDYLQKAREIEREKHADASIQAKSLSAQLEELRAEEASVKSSAALTKIEESILNGEAERAGLEQEQAIREAMMAELGEALDATHKGDKDLALIEESKRAVQADMADLRNRKLMVNLTRASATDQVRIIDPAKEPKYPSSPEVVLYTGAGFFISILLAVFAVIAFDTLSPTLKTSSDLTRTVEDRALARVDRGLLRLAETGADGSKREQARRQALGAELERAMAVHGLLDAPKVLVTSFASGDRQRSGVLAVAGALAARGRDVLCRLDGTPGTPRAVAGGRVRFDGEDADVVLEALPAVSDGFRWSEAAERSTAVLCLVPGGGVSEDDVQSFRRRAGEVGLSEAAFVLLET